LDHGESKRESAKLRIVTEERKFELLFAATVLAARKLAELGELADRPCPAGSCDSQCDF
jgi:hypothetical protein